MADAFVELDEGIGDGGGRRVAVTDGAEEGAFQVDDGNVAEELLSVAVNEAIRRRRGRGS